MILFKLLQNTNKEMESAYEKWYAYPVITETIGIDGLSNHMSSHNTGFSPGQVKGILTDMVKCIKELVLRGVAVKIDDLAIFTLGIVNKEGAAQKEKFTVSGNIESVKLRSRATGELTRAKLNLEASLMNIEKLTKGKSDNGDGNSGEPITPANPSKDPDKDTPSQGGDKKDESGTDSSDPNKDNTGDGDDKTQLD